MKKRTTYGLSLVLLLFACGCNGGGASLPPGDTAEERCANWVEGALTVEARTRGALLQALGAPDSVLATTEPNRHIPDGIDSLITVNHQGIVFSVRKPPAGGDLVERIVVRDNRWLRWTEPGIGTSAERVVQSIGEPAEREATLLRYSCGTGIVEEPVSFVLENGRVLEILFEFYVD
jgi:hypothetical protein